MHDLIIIGAGPSGLTAALYAGRFRLDTIVLEKLSCGGQIILSPSIDNYPGFPGGITPFDLIDKFKQQVEELGIEIKSQEALEVEFVCARAAFTVFTEDTTYEAKSIIVATGAQPKRLGVVNEERFIGRGVSYCATCDAPMFKNKQVIVVGGGDRAVEEALFLAGYASSVTLVHRRNAFRASKILEEKARSNDTIHFVFESVVEEIVGKERVQGVGVKNVSTGEAREISCEGIFIFVGIVPHTAFLKNMLNKDEQGFIITDQSMLTNVPGVFSCGDCRQKSLYQVISAASDGAVAADSAHKYLLGL